MSAFAFLLRAFGLEIINSLSRKWKGPEKPKTVLKAHCACALSHVSIHIPSLASLAVLIWLNYDTLYIGPTFTVWGQSDTVLLAVIQILTKLLELLCVASLSTIVLQSLRRELLGDGIPIGLLGAGTWFASISSFWSPEFLVAARWSITSFGRCQLYLLLAICGAIAVVIGPSSAVLMLPRYQNMPAGGTSFYLPATTGQLYPDTVTAATELDLCILANATEYAACPSGGFSSLRSTFKTLNYTNFNEQSGFRFSPQIQAAGAYGDWYHYDITIQSPLSLIPPVFSTFGEVGDNGANTIQPHAATVTLMQQLVRSWADLAGSITTKPEGEWKWSYDLVTSGTAMNPAIRTKCTGPQVLLANATEAEFPFLQRTETPYSQSGNATAWAYNATSWAVYQSSSITDINRNQTDHLRSQWVSLPAQDFGDFHLQPSGLLVELPWTDTARTVFGCSVAAAWHNATVTADRATSYDAWKIDLNFKSNEDGYIPQNSNDVDASNRPVLLDRSWLELLSSSLPSVASGNGTWTPNTLELLLDDAGYSHLLQDMRSRPHLFRNDSVCYFEVLDEDLTSTETWPEQLCDTDNTVKYIELLVTLVVADGLSRFGSHRVFDIKPSLADWAVLPAQVFNTSYLMKQLPSSAAQNSELLSRWLTINVVGYGYYASTTTDYLALAVICVYLALVTFHLLWTLGRAVLGKEVTSSSWDTITELLVLCQNSPPPAVDSALANTSGGIRHLGTYSTAVSIRATKSRALSGEKTLQLVLNDERDKTINEVVVPNTKYS